MEKWLKFVMGLLFVFAQAKAAFLTNVPVTLKQADGSTLNLLASGDEFFNRLHDEKGFTIMQADDGFYYYAEQKNGKLVPSVTKVGKNNPASLGLKPNLVISEEDYQIAKSKFFQTEETKTGKAPHEGTLNNLVVYIRFSDQQEFTQPRSFFDNILNSKTAGANSVYNYYQEVSYGKLNLTSSHYPTAALTTNLSYADIYPRGYYSPYNATSNPSGYQESERAAREHALLKRAVEYVSSQIPASMVIDGDNDGEVDNVSFIIRGGNDAWSSLLWPHRWNLSTYYVAINGKRVSDYIFMLGDASDYLNRKVFCHELFHALGAPDLYHYNSDGKTPVGGWDIMESGSGHMGAYMKWKYAGQKWITSIPVISQAGNYQLNPLTSSTNNCYKIASPNSSTEFFILEFRQKGGSFENNLSGSGLVVYRINTAYNGNAYNGDGVYVYRPGGTTSINGNVNNAHFPSGTGLTYMNSTTNPSPFLANGTQGGLKLSNIVMNGNILSFTYGDAVAGPTVNITSPANNAQFNMGSTVNIAATATDPAKSVSKVDFYIDGVLKGTDTSSPYQYSWVSTGSSSGTHAIKSIVTDNQNLTAENSISVSLMNGTPQVQITSPANNAQFNMGSTVNIAATATDPTKSVSKVDFYIDGILKGTDTSSPYQYSWLTTGYTSGTHAIKTIVTNTQNLTAENSISVSLMNGTPQVQITSPANNAQFNMGSTVNIAATATDPAKSVSKVEFYIDGILKGTDTSSPYQYSWVTTGSSSGTHAIKAIVTDNQNLTAENSISVSLMNGTPQVQITSPANNAQFNMGSTVNIAATATDQAKLVSKVDFYIDGVLKGTDTSSPYQYSWVTTGSSSGTHAIKTIVTDDQNLTAESSISVTLNTSTETIILSEGFENQFPPANWTADTAPRCWYQSIEFPHLGNKCAAVEWNHTMTAGASITTPALALPAVLNKNYVLEFWWIDKDYWSSKEKNTKNKIKTDGYDFTYCEISTNGTSWTEVAKIGGGAAMTQFVKVTVDLTPYQGSAVKIRWRDTNSGNDNSVGTGLDDVKITLQTGSSIDQNLSIENLICSNYPNPFNPETIISFNNLQEGMVNLAVFNSRGEIVEELVNRNLQKGIHSIKFDGSSLNSGIYFYRLTANQKYYTRKMMLLK